MDLHHALNKDLNAEELDMLFEAATDVFQDTTGRRDSSGAQ